MGKQYAIGDMVTRRDVRKITGTVTAIRDGRANVQWTPHTATWTGAASLMLVRRSTEGQ